MEISVQTRNTTIRINLNSMLVMHFMAVILTTLPII
jgi:hypothetical protein